jgi:hypothetical protein
LWIGSIIGVVLAGLAVAAIGSNTTTLHSSRREGFDSRVAELAKRYGAPKTQCATFYIQTQLNPKYGDFSAMKLEAVHAVCLIDGKELREWVAE